MAPPDYAASAYSEKVSVLALIKFSVFTETFAALCLARIIIDTQSKPFRPQILKEQKMTKKERITCFNRYASPSLTRKPIWCLHLFR